MGKRTKEKTDEEIERKIIRLQKELRNRGPAAPAPPPLPASVSPVSPVAVEKQLLPNEDRDYDYLYCSSYNYEDEVDLLYAYPAPGETYDDNPMSVFTIALTDAQQADDQLTEEHVNSVVIPVPAQAEEDKIPDELLEVLGEAKKSEEMLGKKIPQGVSERWGKILLDGLAKDHKEALLNKTLIPENFQLAKAPKLNAEVSSVLNDPAKNRDKRLEKLQNQLGSAIAGLVNLTTDLINKDIEKMEMIKKLSEVNQILLDLHHEETVSRRQLIIPMIDKNFIKIIQNVKRDQFLFGDNLGDNIRTTKSIEKTSLQIKKQVQPQSVNRKPLGLSGNSKAPVRHTGGPAAARAQLATSRYYASPRQYPPPPPAGPRRLPATTRRPPPLPRDRSRPRR